MGARSLFALGNVSVEWEEHTALCIMMIVRTRAIELYTDEGYVDEYSYSARMLTYE